MKAKQPAESRDDGGREQPKRKYETPRLIDYGLVSKLTLTGGITTRDTGSMQRRCL